jgi:hypothetical protein
MKVYGGINEIGEPTMIHPMEDIFWASHVHRIHSTILSLTPFIQVSNAPPLVRLYWFGYQKKGGINSTKGHILGSRPKLPG